MDLWWFDFVYDATKDEAPIKDFDLGLRSVNYYQDMDLVSTSASWSLVDTYKANGKSFSTLSRTNNQEYIN